MLFPCSIRLFGIALALAGSLMIPGHAQENSTLVGLADGFDFPCGNNGSGNGEAYRLARGWTSGHPGEDWNGVGGGNTDLGDPVYNIGRGVVILAGHHGGGWGNTVIVRHAYRDPRTGMVDVIDSFYTHLDRIDVEWGEVIERGEQVGTIGTNNGMYVAHLHFEIRHGPGLGIGTSRPSFPRDMRHYHRPTSFIRDHRQLRADDRSGARLRIDQFQDRPR